MASIGFTFLFGVFAVQVISVLGADCNWRFFKHYEQKACRAVIGQNDCPDKFRCEALSEEDQKTCVHNGKIYKAGEDIKELGDCDDCRCEVDTKGSASIECSEVDCPDWEPKNKSCYMGYKPEMCCPEEMCPSKDAKSQKICSHDGKKYKIGQFIQTSNPCKKCICTEEWTDENGAGCSLVNCITGIYAKKIRAGCLMIYNERSCCLTGTYCGDIYGGTLATGDDKDNYCHYQGRYYEKGSIANLDDQCITCTCNTPPDFTCVRKSCPPKPRADCKTLYAPCCPRYECP